jgi:hypothetical protein
MPVSPLWLLSQVTNFARFGTSVTLLLLGSCSLTDANQLRRLVAGLSFSMPEFDPGLVHMLLVVHTLTPGTLSFPSTSLYLRQYLDIAAPYAYIFRLL